MPVSSHLQRGLCSGPQLPLIFEDVWFWEVSKFLPRPASQQPPPGLFLVFLPPKPGWFPPLHRPDQRVTVTESERGSDPG